MVLRGTLKVTQSQICKVPRTKKDKNSLKIKTLMHLCQNPLFYAQIQSTGKSASMCDILLMCFCTLGAKRSCFSMDQQAAGEKHSQILFMETLRVSSLGQSARKWADTLSTLFLLRSSVLISGRHSGTCSSFTLLLQVNHRCQSVFWLNQCHYKLI